MLSDEEKKAVDKIKTLIQYLNVWKENFTIVPEDVKYLVTVLNLIEKQSKEIEELKRNKGYHLGFIDGGIAKRYEMEDKIKAKIEELDMKDLTICYGVRSYGRTFQQSVITEVKNVLESLLEKE